MCLSERLSRIHCASTCGLLLCVALSGLSACSDDGAPPVATQTPTVAAATPTSTPLPPTATPTPTTVPGHRISGLVSASVCSSALADTDVVLSPAQRVTATAADGTFAFDGVADGEYSLLFPVSQSSLTVTVAGRDETVAFCVDCPLSLQIEPRRGPVGTAVSVSGGNCYALHSGRPATILFDDVPLAFFHGSQAGNYEGTIVIPAAAPGPHTLRLPNADLPFGPDIATNQFIVTPP